MTEEQSTLIANFRYGVIAPMVVQPPARGEQARMLRELAGREYNIPFSASTRIHVTGHDKIPANGHEKCTTLAK